MEKKEINICKSETWLRADITDQNNILQETINDFIEPNERIINIQMVTDSSGCSRFWIYLEVINSPPKREKGE